MNCRGAHCAPSGCRKTNFGTSRTPSPTKAFTKNSQIVGAGALNTCPSPLSLRDISPHCGESPDSPFFTIIYDFFDKLGVHIVRPHGMNDPKYIIESEQNLWNAEGGVPYES